MTIPLTGTGGLFTRLGKMAALLNAVNKFRGTSSIPVTNLSGSGTAVTVTTLFGHNYTVGDTVTIAGASVAGYNGSQTVASVPTATTFTLTNATTGAFTGTVTSTKTAGAGFFAVGPYTDNIVAQFQATDQNVVSDLYVQRDSYRGVHSGLTQTLQTLAQSCLIQMANEDTPLATQTLTAALVVLIAQMKTAVASVGRPTVSTTVTAGTNLGGGVLVASALQGTGLQGDYIIQENLSVACVSDSQGGATAGQEQFSLTAPAAEADPLNWDWPLGSGASLSLTATDSTQSASGGNLLQNSNWGTFTNANSPDNWPVATGTPGGTILQATGANVYNGTSGLALVGNGAELTSLQQPFNATPSTSLGAGGTPSTLSPSTVYALNGWLKVSSVPAAGVLEIALVDNSGVIQTDAQGVACSLTKSLPAATTGFLPLNGFIRTPAVLPAAGYKLRVRLSTALSNTVSLYLSNLSLTKAQQVYAGGPYVALFSGTPVFILNDTFTVAVANNYSSLWAQALQRLFGLTTLGLVVPSSGSPTIADSLIA